MPPDFSDSPPPEGAQGLMVVYVFSVMMAAIALAAATGHAGWFWFVCGVGGAVFAIVGLVMVYR